MKLPTLFRSLSLLLVATFVVSPCMGQRRGAAPARPAPAPPRVTETPPTLENLLGDDTYKIYSEIRNAGALVRSTAVNDLIEPVMKLSGSPKEFKTVLNWIRAHSDALAGSRIVVASWSTKPMLPSVLMVVELASAEEAKKFEGDLRGFLPKLLPKPSPSPSPAGPVAPATLSGKGVHEKFEETVGPSYEIKQAGSLVLLSDKAVALKDLRPRGSKLLTENPLFATARNRFPSESVFLYVDLKSIQKEQEDQLRKYEEEDRIRREKEAANPPKVEEIETEIDDDPMLVPPDDRDLPIGVSPTPDPGLTSEPTLKATVPEEGVDTVTLADNPPSSAGLPDSIMYSIYAAFFGGPRKWPDGVAAAANFEDENYSLRVLILDGDDNKSSPVPFVPMLISGPAITPAAQGIMPADTNMFVSLSVDYHQIYEGMVKTIAHMEEGDPRKSASQPVSNPSPPASPFAEYEKRIGLKVKEDLIPLLGNEIGIAIPKQSMVAPSPSPSPSPESGKDNAAKQDSANRPKPAEPSFTPVIAIGVKDREGVKRLIPKIIEGMGLKGANMFAQTEKLEDVEITSYAGIFSFAFIGDFLVVSPDPKLTRHVADSYLKREILASDSNFRNSTRWQPRQLQGQAYIAPAVIDLYYPLGKEQPDQENARLRELISGMGPVLDALTYSLSNDGIGPLHELRVPKNLLMFMIAGMTSQASESSVMTNESIARSLMRTISSGQATFKMTKGDGRYGTLEELISEGLVSKDLMDRYGYRIEVTALSNKFEATAMPLEYGKTGRMSFFVDDSGVLRGGDHGGGPATLSDKPVEQ